MGNQVHVSQWYAMWCAEIITYIIYYPSKMYSLRIVIKRLDNFFSELRMMSERSWPLNWVLKYAWHSMCWGKGVNNALWQNIRRCWQLLHRYICFLRKENILAQKLPVQCESVGARSRLPQLVTSRWEGWECLGFTPQATLEIDPLVVLWRLEGQHDAINVMVKVLCFKNLLRSQRKVCSSLE